MATTFPTAIQTFPTMQDISTTDATLIASFITAMNNGDVDLANQILATIPDYNEKMWTAALSNTVTDTCIAVQQYFADRYSNGYIVSATEPIGQETGDFWFEVL